MVCAFSMGCMFLTDILTVACLDIYLVVDVLPRKVWAINLRRKLMKKILIIAVIIALTAISGIAFAEDLVQIPVTKEALVGTWVGKWDRGYNTKRVSPFR